MNFNRISMYFDEFREALAERVSMYIAKRISIYIYEYQS